MTHRAIAIVNYGLGNLRSVANAFRKVGAASLVTSAASEITDAAGLVIPGVGAFAQGMTNLRDQHLVDTIRAFAASGRPVLGICLGMQLLFDDSEEHGSHPGLSLVSGHVKKLTIDNPAVDRLPHVQWTALADVIGGQPDSILTSADVGRRFYFVHSYAAQLADRATALAWADYGGHRFCAAVQAGNVVGVQFHPEKSGPDGLAVIARFARGCTQQ